MEHSRLKALSPADGRYADKVGSLREILSEYGLIRYRVLVEIRWLQTLADEPAIGELPPLSPVMKDMLNQVIDEFDADDAQRIKKIEATTNHDVKAVEYFIRERLGNGADARKIGDFIHFACTSEDINNLAYALTLRTARDDVLLPQMRELSSKLRAMTADYAALAMLSRTHGQAASPTTLGKELANVVARLAAARDQLAAVNILGKFNGAVGNFNAHVAAYPDVDWPAVSQRFVESLGLMANQYTTQIEPHDWTAAYAHALIRYNTVLIDFCRDVWGYVSLGYFRQRAQKDEVGSSTMPHKVNPIDFENAEGNLGIANALFDHFANKLPISRWQRDLSDSTVQRNFGVALAHMVIAIQSVIRGLGKLQADPDAIARDIGESWEVLGEAVQTVMRRYGIPEPYEKLKEMTRGKVVDRELMHELIESLEIPDEAKKRLLDLTPSTYTGLAEFLAANLR
ncbi:MAG: adenylosuccinate lyase [Woeseiaceae bacterium]|nr:adenylosuccinate lyase [Woeseiaceae bacterium]